MQLVSSATVYGQAPGDNLTQTLFRLLDKNKDGKLSKEELAVAEKVLMAVDADEDEMVTVDELLPNLNRMNGRRAFIRRSGRQNMQPNSDFILVNAGDPPANITRRLLAKYGRKSAGAAEQRSCHGVLHVHGRGSRP